MKKKSMTRLETSVESIRQRYILRTDGGKGSGNWGHAGRPGKVGGSQENPEAAFHHRYVDAKTGAYTSFAKEKKKAATPHQASVTELKRLPLGSRIIANGTIYEKIGKAGEENTKWTDVYTGEVIGSYTLNKDKLWGKNIKVAIPASAEPELKKAVHAGGSMIGTKKAGEKKEEPKKTEEKKTETSESEETPDFFEPTDTTFSPYIYDKESSASGSSSKGSGESSEGSAAVSKIKTDEVFGAGTGYDEARVSKAAQYDDEESYDNLGLSAADSWDKLTKAEREALFEYTRTFSVVNEPLTGRAYLGGETGTTERINKITSALDKCEIPEDIIITHGIGNGGCRSIFKIDDSESLLSGLKDRIGTVGYNGAFTSCNANGENPLDKPVVMHIFVPKGAKGIYAEPFSAYGYGARSASWDGLLKQTSVSIENEVILQRGGMFKLTNVEEKGYEVHVYCELVGQDPDRVKEKDWAPYGK